MKKPKFPYLMKDIKTAPIIEVPRIDGRGTYKFKAYSFGELGSKMSPELIKEISEGLTESVRRNFPDFDLVVGIDPGAWCAFLVAYNLRKPFTYFMAPTHVDALFVLRYPELWEPWPRKKLKELYKDWAKKFPEKFSLVGIRSAYATETFLYIREDFADADKVLVVDDIVSGGSTLDKIFEVLSNELNVEVVGAQVILAKSDSYKKLEEKWGIPIKFLVKDEV